MKIAIFVTYTYPYIGSGIGNVALAQAEGLVSLGHDVTVISSNFPKTEGEFTRNKVKHLKLSAIYFLEKFHVPVPLYLFNRKAIKLIKTSDIIHIHDSVYPSSVLACLLGKFYHKPIILTQHVAFITYPNFVINYIQKFAYLTIGKLTFHLSDRIIYFNPEVKKLIGNDKKIIFLPNGVDLQLFNTPKASEKSLFRAKYNLPINKKLILFVGRFVPKKGYRLLFEARNDKYLTLFIGSGEIPEFMKKAKNVIFFPAKKQKELSEIYKLSDIFVLPSYGEGFPLSIQEAMASGLPIITSKENIFDTSIDFIKTVDRNVSAIKKAIFNLITNNKLTSIMSKKSRRFAEKNYSWSKNLDLLTKLYHKVSN